LLEKSRFKNLFTLEKNSVTKIAINGNTENKKGPDMNI
jgi:hypothetical protein